MTASNENLYVIYCVDAPTDRIVDDPNGGRRRGGIHRMAAIEEHNSYQLATSSPNHECYIHKIAVVPMLASDGVTMIGSCFMVKATREECERFIQADPFSVKKVWNSISIQRFNAAGAVKQEDQQQPWVGSTNNNIKTNKTSSSRLYQTRLAH